MGITDDFRGVTFGMDHVTLSAPPQFPAPTTNLTPTSSALEATSSLFPIGFKTINDPNRVSDASITTSNEPTLDSGDLQSVPTLGSERNIAPPVHTAQTTSTQVRGVYSKPMTTIDRNKVLVTIERPSRELSPTLQAPVSTEPAHAQFEPNITTLALTDPTDLHSAQELYSKPTMPSDKTQVLVTNERSLRELSRSSQGPAFTETPDP